MKIRPLHDRVLLKRLDDQQGMLKLLYVLQEMLAEIAGLPAVSLQPAAGAQGELAALLVASAWFRSRGETRTRVIFPSSAHGTNPASASIAGFECVQLENTSGGLVDLDELETQLDDQTAVFMITNPNTLGLFETQIESIAARVHDAGGLVYIDGANMNAIMGVTRPGDFGGDMMHFNVHKTFTGPHGAGGPGAGPIAVRSELAEFLPGPVVTRTTDDDGQPRFELETPNRSIGRVRSFFGNVGILLRGYCYLRTLGREGVREAARHAVLNANYLKALLADLLPAPFGQHCMHEFVGFGYGCNLEEHIKYGQCLDGRCSTRGTWEKSNVLEAKVAAERRAAQRARRERRRSTLLGLSQGSSDFGSFGGGAGA